MIIYLSYKNFEIFCKCDTAVELEWFINIWIDKKKHITGGGNNMEGNWNSLFSFEQYLNGLFFY